MKSLRAEFQKARQGVPLTPDNSRQAQCSLYWGFSARRAWGEVADGLMGMPRDNQ